MEYGKKTSEELKAQYKKKVEEAKAKALKLHSNYNDFKQIDSKNGVTVAKKQLDEGQSVPFVLLSVEFETDMTPHEVTNYIWKIQTDEKTRSKLSQYVDLSTILIDLKDESKSSFEELNGDRKRVDTWEIAYVQTKAPATLVSPRSFLFQKLRWGEKDNSIIRTVSTSVEHPDYGNTSGVVRGTLFNSWKLEQVVDSNTNKKKIIGHYITMSDPSGWIPGWLVKQGAIGEPFKFVQTVKKYVENK